MSLPITVRRKQSIPVKYKLTGHARIRWVQEAPYRLSILKSEGNLHTSKPYVPSVQMRKRKRQSPGCARKAQLTDDQVEMPPQSIFPSACAVVESSYFLFFYVKFSVFETKQGCSKCRSRNSRRFRELNLETLAGRWWLTGVDESEVHVGIFGAGQRSNGDPTPELNMSISWRAKQKLTSFQ